MDHIERFEDLVLSIKANGVSEDYLLCKLLPYSLVGEGASWLKQLKAGSLKTWRSIKIAFLNNFYDDAKSEELRNKLSTFTQGPAEAFKAAWVRFKEYQRDYQHHGFSEVQLLGTFLRGVDWRYYMEKILTSLPKDASETCSSPLNRYAKRLVDNGISSDEAKLLTRDISAIMLPKVKKEKAQPVDIVEYIYTISPDQTTEKVPDPGSFVLDCFISTSRFSRSLSDLGSSINLMPKSVAERVGMTHYRPTRITLLFADRSKRIPEGILEDVPVKVGNSIIPADFVVLDYEKESKDPLILERAFLATAGARFDV